MCGGGLPGSASVTVCPVGSDPRSSEWLTYKIMVGPYHSKSAELCDTL